MHVTILRMLSTGSLSAFTAAAVENLSARGSVVRPRAVDAVRQAGGQAPAAFSPSANPQRPGGNPANPPGSRLLPRGSLLDLSV